jgi:hypothetical protein
MHEFSQKALSTAYECQRALENIHVASLLEDIAVTLEKTGRQAAAGIILDAVRRLSR